jgi:cytochrome c
MTMAGPGPRLEDPSIVTATTVISWLAVSSIAAVLSLGCGDSASGDGDTNTREPEASAFSEQVIAGKNLFMRHCAHCHGSNGEGGDAPRLVDLSRGALPLEPPASARVRSGEFRTAGDVADFASTNMPIDAPGSLTSDEYYALVAFLLDENGITSDRVLDTDSAASLQIAR